MVEKFKVTAEARGLDDLLVQLMDAEKGNHVPPEAKQALMAMRMMAPGIYEALDRLSDSSDDLPDILLAVVRASAVLLAGVVIPSVKHPEEIEHVGELTIKMFSMTMANSFKEASEQIGQRHASGRN